MGASFARTNAQKKQHKERSQPFNRQRYGLLEKKKDYVLRATDYKAKQKRLKTLREKAANKNEDEFYFGMVNGSTKRGVAVKERGNTALSQAVTKVLKTQDGGYIKTLAAVERRKLDALVWNQHLLPPDNDDDEQQSSSTGEAANKKRVHRVFVDSREEMESLDPVERLHTTERNLSRTENRRAENAEIDMSPEARLQRRKFRAAKAAKVRERDSREARLKSLAIAQRETEVHRALQTKGSRRKIGVDQDGVPRYKWKQERKR